MHPGRGRTCYTYSSSVDGFCKIFSFVYHMMMEKLWTEEFLVLYFDVFFPNVISMCYFPWYYSTCVTACFTSKSFSFKSVILTSYFDVFFYSGGRRVIWKCYFDVLFPKFLELFFQNIIFYIILTYFSLVYFSYYSDILFWSACYLNMKNIFFCKMRSSPR